MQRIQADLAAIANTPAGSMIEYMLALAAAGFVCKAVQPNHIVSVPNVRLVDMVCIARHNVRRDHRNPALCVWSFLVVWTRSACNQPPSGDEDVPFD